MTPRDPFTRWEFEGFDVVSYIPEDPVALVYVFHGAGGSAAFAEEVETVDVLNELVDRGYGFVSMSSSERTGRMRWNAHDASLESNPDLARLTRLQSHLVETTGVEDATPLAGVGFSSGARMVTLWGQIWADAGYPVDAVAPYNGRIATPVDVSGGLTVPSFFVTVDNHITTQAVVQNYEATRDAGAPAELHVATETDLQAERFTRIPGVDVAEADAVFEAYVDAGLWNAAGERQVPIDTVRDELATVSLPASVGDRQAEIIDQCEVVLAVHQMRAEFKIQMADFFDAQRSAPAGPDAAVSVRWSSTMAGASNEDEFDGVAVAPDGSAYVTGKFEGTVTLGDAVLNSAGAADIPFARFDAQGHLVWAQRFGGPGEDNFFDVEATAEGAVAAGWLAGTVEFGSVTLTSSGPSDCVVIGLGPGGSTRWARAFGGPARDGCNEISIDSSGAVTTSIDTQGDWTLLDGRHLPAVEAADTVLLRLGASGSPTWMRPVLGAGAQRGKALAVAPDGSVSFGGDTVGGFTIDGQSVQAPDSGGRRDAWLSHWTPDGTLQWSEAWGGPGDDLAKGVADDGQTVTYVGPFTGTITVGETTLDATYGSHMLVAQRSVDGEVNWATSVSADTAVGGAEVIGATDGGILFGSGTVPGLRFGSNTGDAVTLDDSDGGTAWLAHYTADGTPAFARTIAGTDNGRLGEIARIDTRVYVDIALNTTGNKDASLWALDLDS